MSRPWLIVRGLLVGATLLTLACDVGEEPPRPATSPADAGPPAPPDNKVVHFLPVTVFSTSADSLIRAVSKPRPGTGIVVLRDDRPGMNGEVLSRPEMWFDLDDGSIVHMTTDGVGRDPTVTTFERMGETIRLELVNGVPRAIYTDASGKQTTFTDDSGPLTQPQMEESAESMVDRTLKWFMSCRHHPVVDKAWRTVEKLNSWATSLQTAFDDAKQTFGQGHKVYVKQPIAPMRTEPLSATGVTRLLQELNSRALGRATLDSQLPTEVFVRDEVSQELVPATTYAPPRIPCMKEYKRDGLLTMVRYTCAATTDDCVAAKGNAFERRADCEAWCDRQDDPRAALASYDPAKHELLCYQQQCNDEFDDLPWAPVKNERACALGCAHDLCSGGLGACEIPTENAQGQVYTVCKNDLTKGFCEAGPTPELFVPGKKCEEIGYPYWNSAESVWRMTQPTSYDAGTPKLDGPKADAGAGTDGPRTDAGAGTDAPRSDGGGTIPTKVCGGRFEILEVGTPKPASYCDKYSSAQCNGSGRVYDTATRLTWTRNELASVFRSDFAEAATACSKIGMRLPTMPELKAVAPLICADAVHWGAKPYMTSTDHPDPDPAWRYCVAYPGGTEDYCINNVGLVCVK